MRISAGNLTAGRAGRILVPLLLVVAGTLIWWWAQRAAWRQTENRTENLSRLAAELPRLDAVPSYVTANQCQSCHPSQHASWHRSFHRTMTQIAAPENVAGAFDGSTIVSDELSYRVFREGEGFWAEMPDPDVMMYVVQGGKKLAPGKVPRVKAPVVMTTGSHHYQTYWVASPRYDRLLQTLPLVYLLADRKWIPREAAFMRGPDDAGRFITQWNHHCIRCHSTAGVPGLNDQTGMLDTRVGDLGISCEACHGPGESHIRRHQNPLSRYVQHLRGTPDPTIVNPSRLNHRASSQVCGQCHGVFIEREELAMKFAHEGSAFRPGDELETTRYYIQYPTTNSAPDRWDDLRKNPSFFRERWWDDGTILAGGREYSAMAVAPCFARGQMSCLSCHSMHESEPDDQLKAGMEGNASCTQCHLEPRFTTGIARHTFHAPRSEGSQCLNCHMPHTTYALLKAIRSHQISSPSVAPSARQGVPNACNLCHLDKTLAWTQDQLVARYGQKPVEIGAEEKQTSAALLWLVKGHAAQRVISAWHFGWPPAQAASGTNNLAPFLTPLLQDPYGVVRYVAARSLRTLPGFGELKYDFMAPPEELRRVADETYDRSQKMEPGLPDNEPAMLLGPEGRVDKSRLQQLLQRRDNRSVTIKE